MIYRKVINFPQNNLSDTRFFACVKLNYFTKLCCFVALTWCRRHIGIQQEKIKGQKNRENNENNRLARRCSIVMCPVLTSSTPRSLPKYFYQGKFYYNYYKSCYLGKNCVQNIW